MAEQEVTYFKCGHRTVWGIIAKRAAFRYKKGDSAYCGRCKKHQPVARTVRENC